MIFTYKIDIDLQLQCNEITNYHLYSSKNKLEKRKKRKKKNSSYSNN